MNCPAFSWFDLGTTAIVLLLLAVLVIAYLVQFTRYAYCWWLMVRACGGQRQALTVVCGLRWARDLDTDERMRRGIKAAESMRLVKR